MARRVVVPYGRQFIDAAVMGNSSEFDLEVRRLRAEGLSAEEAWRRTFMDNAERVVDAGMRSERYGLITGLSEYGGEYLRQHPEVFDALVSGKSGWGGDMWELPPGGAQGLFGLPGAVLAPGGRMGDMPIPIGPAEVKDDWEIALEEVLAEGDGADPEDVDFSGERGIVFDRDTEGAGKTVIDSVPKTRVGQWMSKAEYEQFLKTGEIPRTNVLTNGMDGYIKQANKGDYYVEFDIDSSLLVPKNEALGWSLIKPKNQMYIKLYQNKGLILPDPIGTNIAHVYTK